MKNQSTQGRSTLQLKAVRKPDFAVAPPKPAPASVPAPKPTPKPAQHTGGNGPHPLAYFEGRDVVIQLRNGAGRYAGRVVELNYGMLVLESAKVYGTKFSCAPADGVVMVSLAQIREPIGPATTLLPKPSRR